MASRKFQKSIEIIDSYEGITGLVLEEGSEEWMLPVVNDSIISYLLSKEGLTDSLESLAIVNCPNITAEGYRKLTTLQSLRSLKLKKLPVNSAEVNMLVGKLDSLRFIDLIDNDQIDSVRFSERRQRLGVNINRCNKIRKVYGENNPYYISITFEESLASHKTEISIENSNAVYLGFLKEDITDSLKIRIDSTASIYLHFLSCRFDEHYQFFSSMPYITEIMIRQASTERLTFSDLPQLKTLNIDQFGDEEGIEMKRITIKNVPKLTYLGIRSENLDELQVKGVDSLSAIYLFNGQQDFNIQGIDELKALSNFEKYGAILNDHLFEQVLKLPHISTFGYGVDTLIDKQLTHIAQSKKIKELSISPLRKASDLDRVLEMDNIASLDIGSSPIKVIHIDSHPTLRKFKARSISEFEELEITNCNLLEELSLEMMYPEKVVIRNVPNLTALNMGLCHLDDDKAFENQLNQLPSLKQLSLETCNKPLDLRGLKNLEWIWFKNGESKVILNRHLKDSVYTNDYKGPIVYVEN